MTKVIDEALSKVEEKKKKIDSFSARMASLLY